MNPTSFDFRPFRAWRYHPGRVELSRVIAPPYDVISPSEQEALYAKSPFNVVRLILGKEADFYEHARKCWEEWVRKGILVQDEKPALYLYEQVFRHPWDSRPLRRLALVGILKLEETGAVLRHEATFEAPKKDRFLLLEKTKTNLSPIFGLYENPEILSTLSALSRAEAPLFEARDDQGVLHRGWAVQKKEDQKAVHEALAGEKILIADGHHRYETALEYRRRMRQKFPSAPPEAPFDFVMMALAASGDEGLLVLPTHRIIRSLAPLSEKDFLKQLSQHFDLRPHPDQKVFQALLARPETEKVFGGVFREAGSFILSLKNIETTRRLLPSGKSPIWYEVEAHLLSHLIFDVLWTPPSEKRQGLVAYTRSSEEAIQAVREGRAEAAFLLRTPRVDTIRKLAYAGERMPQKTTYFYPKLASGLFFYHQGQQSKIMKHGY